MEGTSSVTAVVPSYPGEFRIIPQEIVNMVISHLSLGSLAKLAQTHSLFKALLAPLLNKFATPDLRALEDEANANTLLSRDRLSAALILRYYPYLISEEDSQEKMRRLADKSVETLFHDLRSQAGLFTHSPLVPLPFRPLPFPIIQPDYFSLTKWESLLRSKRLHVSVLRLGGAVSSLLALKQNERDRVQALPLMRRFVTDLIDFEIRTALAASTISDQNLGYATVFLTSSLNALGRNLMEGKTAGIELVKLYERGLLLMASTRTIKNWLKTARNDNPEKTIAALQPLTQDSAKLAYVTGNQKTELHPTTEGFQALPSCWILKRIFTNDDSDLKFELVPISTIWTPH